MTNMDGDAKAELLTFLVVGQLFAFARAGEWLRTDQLIKSAQMWLSSNGGVCDWLERAQLVEACRVVAIKALDLPFPEVEADLVQLFNLNRGWFLDYRKPVVQQIHVMCVAHISHPRRKHDLDGRHRSGFDFHSATSLKGCSSVCEPADMGAYGLPPFFTPLDAALRRIWKQHPQEDVRRLALEAQCGRYAISELEAMAAEGNRYSQNEHTTVADARKSLCRLRPRLMEELQRIGPITWQKRR